MPFHIELRQFPHNFCRFNLNEVELRTAVLDPWSRGEQVEIGERLWDPKQASLTVLEGPRLSMPELAMGRGWRNAARAGTDVTERMLAFVPTRQTARADQEVDRVGAVSLGEQVASLLGSEPLPLLRAWQLALESHPDRSPSECLSLAEDLLRR